MEKEANCHPAHMCNHLQIALVPHTVSKIDDVWSHNVMGTKCLAEIKYLMGTKCLAGIKYLMGIKCLAGIKYLMGIKCLAGLKYLMAT